MSFISEINEIIKFVKEISLPSKILYDKIKVYNDTLEIHNKKFRLFGDIYVVSLGKASCSMIDGILGQSINIKDCLVITKKGYITRNCIEKCNFFESSHPYPSNLSILAGRKLIEFLRKIKENDTLIVLLSGGTSSLCEVPIEGLKIKDIIRTNRILINSGLNIKEINKIRIVLSKIKGGKILKFVNTKNIIVIVLSDVIGDNLEFIASGLFYPTTIKKEDINNIIKSYNLWKKLPRNVLNALNNYNEEKTKLKTPEHIIIANNEYIINKLTDFLSNKSNIIKVKKNLMLNVTELSEIIVQDIVENINKPGYLIYGGEWYVNVKGTGKGGPNQELILHVAKNLIENDIIDRISDRFFIIALDTDGTDGPTDAAGGYLTKNVLSKININELITYLINNDSYSYLTKIGTIIKTGPNNTNLNSVVVVKL